MTVLDTNVTADEYAEVLAAREQAGRRDHRPIHRYRNGLDSFWRRNSSAANQTAPTQTASDTVTSQNIGSAALPAVVVRFLGPADLGPRLGQGWRNPKNSTQSST